MKELNKLIEGLDIKFPVKYDDNGGYILDADGKMLCEVRGWGWIQYMSDDPEEAHDGLGNLIAHALNNLQPKEGEVGRGKCKSREDGVCRLPAGSCEQCDLTAEQLERSLGFKLHEVKVFRNGGWISAASVQPKEQTIIAYVEESLERLRKRNEEEHSEWWFAHRSGEISALEHIVEKFSQSPTEPVSGERTGEGWRERIEEAKKKYRLDWRGELHIILSSISGLIFSKRNEIVSFIEKSITTPPEGE